jgi:hypothetical protein
MAFAARATNVPAGARLLRWTALAAFDLASAGGSLQPSRQARRCRYHQAETPWTPFATGPSTGTAAWRPLTNLEASFTPVASRPGDAVRCFLEHIMRRGARAGSWSTAGHNTAWRIAARIP